jgi:GH15 family glucan-1,4-alpha-glucosidase
MLDKTMVAQPKIDDYGVIGDGRSVALISRAGSLDWLCWPRFDSPSLFGAILDPRTGGCWTIGPTEPARIERRYIEGTNVLATRFRTAAGMIVATDFMPVTSEEQKRAMLWPEHELVRRVECEQGEVEVQSHFDPRPDFGRAKVRIRDTGALGLRLETESGLITLRSDVMFAPAKEGGLTARARLKAGDAVSFSLAFAAEGPAVLSPLDELVKRKLSLTTEWWRQWAARSTYDGPYREQVVRSALALKLMIYAPSGAMIAAPTTSLPTVIGGGENWDYRYCWLRDAAFTARSLFGLGFADEAKAFVSWMLHATRLTRPKLQVLYDVFGGDRSKESVLSHLAGYQNSRPVRIGNHAGVQFQLDPYGEVIEAVSHFVQSGGELDRETQKMLRQFGEYVCQNWHKPDSGIWEERTAGQHYTYSRLMCWVALDRLIEMHHYGHIQGIPIEQFSESRKRIRADIENRGWNPSIESYTQLLDGESLDATALLMAAHRFDEASSQRMQNTHRRIRERLSPAPGLLYRKEQSLTMGEGAFGISCFWDADFLARGGGSIEEAHGAFARTSAYANDLGLFAEQIDPKTGDALGNFPQAFTHVGLINAALSLVERETRNGESAVKPQRIAAGGHEQLVTEVQR